MTASDPPPSPPPNQCPKLWLLPLNVLNQIACELLILGVRLYQVFLGPFLGGHCRFEPTCSRYFIGAIEKHGPWKGTLKGLIRLCKCQPFHPGGYDPP